MKKKKQLVDQSNDLNNESLKETSLKEQNVINNSDGVEEKIKKPDESLEKPLKVQVKENIEKQLEKKNENLKKSEIIDDVAKTDPNKNKKSVTTSKKIKTQFGAFSKRDYAYSSKQSIENEIKKKFSNFSIEVKLEKTKNLYKLIHFSDDLKIANEICEFSKKNKISCLIVK